MKIRFKEEFLNFAKGAIIHTDVKDIKPFKQGDFLTLIKAGIVEEVKEEKDNAGFIIFGAIAPGGIAQPVLMTKEYARKIEKLLDFMKHEV